MIAIVVNRGQSCKAKLSIYQSIDVTCGHELWVVTKRMRLWIQAAKITFLLGVAGLSLRDKVRSSGIWRELRVELLLLRIERSQLRWFGYLIKMPPGHPNHTGEILSFYLIWIGNASGSPRRSGKTLLEPYILPPQPHHCK